MHATIAIAPSIYPEKDQTKYQSSILFLSTVVYIFFSIIMLIFIEPLSLLLKLSPLLCICLLIGGYGRLGNVFANTKFTYEFEAGKNLFIAVLTSIGGIIVSLILFIYIPKEINYYARIIGVTITEFVISVFFAISLFIQGKSFFSREYWKYCLPLSIPYVFHSVSGILLSQSDKIMMQRLLNNSEVGIYSLAYSFSSIMVSIYIALNNSWVPFFFEYARNKDEESLRVRGKNYVELFTVLCIGFVLLTPEVYRIFANEDYWSGSRYSAIFTIGTYFIFLYSFAVNYEAYKQNSKIVAIATTVSAIINIGLNYIFMILYGAIGVVVATAISHGIQFVIHYISAKQLTNGEKYPYPFSFFVRNFVIFFVISILCYLVDAKVLFLRWLTALVLGVFELYRIWKRKTIF